MLKSQGQSLSNNYCGHQPLGIFQYQTCPAPATPQDHPALVSSPALTYTSTSLGNPSCVGSPTSSTMMGHPDANVEHPRGQNQVPLSCSLSSVSEATNMEELRSFTNLPNLVVVNFNAQWCNPCRFMRDKFAVMANQYADHSVIAVQVDIDRVPRAHHVYGVRTVPTFLLYRGGVKVGEVLGSNDGLLRSSILHNL
ncbi:hypothetical protein TWF506_003178 [Arthrobotrys conoides]|uniref:Thioredoxin domain-containing protein n=1 Tax=Arthrobotrys conoides TaxID=74498 RepID=A0AAN8NHS5_9PEZI